MIIFIDILSIFGVIMWFFSYVFIFVFDSFFDSFDFVWFFLVFEGVCWSVEMFGGVFDGVWFGLERLLWLFFFVVLCGGVDLLYGLLICGVFCGGWCWLVWRGGEGGGGI